MRRFAISSWSVDGLLRSGTPLLDLPAQLARHGIGTLEVCHFHLPSTDPDYIQTFRQAIQSAGIELYSVLIDTGDIAAPDGEGRAADIQTIGDWIRIAAALGAGVVRISAGQQPPSPEAIERSGQQLHAFAQLAARHGVRVITENWQRTSQESADLLAILERSAGQVGLCADTGNAEATADKYATLAQLLPLASSVHFKAQYGDDGQIAVDDLDRCVELVEQAKFDGVITLIYAGKEREWAEIVRLREALQPLIQN